MNHLRLRLNVNHIERNLMSEIISSDNSLSLNKLSCFHQIYLCNIKLKQRALITLSHSVYLWNRPLINNIKKALMDFFFFFFGMIMS